MNTPWENMVAFRDNEIYERYLQADASFRAGRLTKREFNERVIEVLLIFLDIYESIQPFYRNMQKMAEESNQNSIKAFGVLPKTQHQDTVQNQPSVANIALDKLKKSYILYYCQYKSGKLSHFNFNQILVHTLLNLLDVCDCIEPHFGEFEKEAETQYQDSLNGNIPAPKQHNFLTNKKIENEKESLPWDVSGLQRSPK